MTPCPFFPTSWAVAVVCLVCLVCWWRCPFASRLQQGPAESPRSVRPGSTCRGCRLRLGGTNCLELLERKPRINETPSSYSFDQLTSLTQLLAGCSVGACSLGGVPAAATQI